MTIDPALIERIYEAAALPDLWPAVLQTIADGAQSRGAVFVTTAHSGVSWISSPRMQQDVADYFAAGWTMKDIASGVIAERSPGFRTETDFLPADKTDKVKVNAQFFRPRGYAAGACTVLQGTKDDMLMCVLEGFGSHAVAKAAVPALDRLRPHLARAMSLTARLRDTRAQATVAALELAGVPAALASGEGRLRAANDRFAARLGERMSESALGLRFADGRVQAAFTGALSASDDQGAVRSVAIAAAGDQPACAMHLLPLRRGARDVFGWDGVLILLAEPANASVPGADLLRLLFDLTPAEARLTRHLLEGRAPAEAAALLAITEHTARTHLRRIFAKTGVVRQSELVRLLLGLGRPGTDAAPRQDDSARPC